MPISDLNQLDLGKPQGSKLPKTLTSRMSIDDISAVPKTIKKEMQQEADKNRGPEQMYETWANDPNNKNLDALLASLSPQIDKSISALVSKPTAAVNSKARLLAIKAVKSYKPGQKAKLTSWVFTQLQPLKRYTQQSMPASTPERMARQQAELFKFEEEFYDNHGRYPSDRELSDLMKFSKKQLQQIRKFNKSRVYEMQQFGANPEDSATASEITGIMPDKTEEMIDLFYDSLSPTEQVVLEYRLGMRGKKKLTNSQVAAKLKLSPARVSQISGLLADRLDEFKSSSKGVL